MKDIQENRIIGEYSSGREGPLLFVTAAVHGNEPSGVMALERVFRELEKSKPDIRGTLVGVLGNQAAFKQNVRFIDEDFNRTWTTENIENHKSDSEEKIQMFSIIEILNKYPPEKFTKRYFLDCHTTSSDSEPYISVQDVNDNDNWAHRFPTHIIRGFSDIVSGTIDHYMSSSGLTGFVLEAGQHESKDAIDYHEGTIWLALQEACGLDLNLLEDYPEAVRKLQNKKTKQKTFEIKYRHGIKEEDDFKMNPGFENFQPVEEGQELAVQNGEVVRSEWNAFIFMPLYQAQGNDGFFIVEEV